MSNYTLFSLSEIKEALHRVDIEEELAKSIWKKLERALTNPPPKYKRRKGDK